MSEETTVDRSLTSACGNVTVTFGAAPAPQVELADTATRMFSRDLAALVTETARAAANAQNEELPLEGGPDLVGAIEHLAALRASLGEQGLLPTLERRRAEYEEPEDRADKHERSFGGAPGLALPAEALQMLDSSLQLLKRVEGHTPPTTKRAAEETPIAKAANASKLVVVEASPEFPIHSVWLSKRACEIGPKVLTREINETVAAAIEALAERQEEHFADMGLPVGPAEAAGMAEEFGQRGEQAAADIDGVRWRQRDFTELLFKGGHFA